jgi:methylmalonyl-CoA mutase
VLNPELSITSPFFLNPILPGHSRTLIAMEQDNPSEQLDFLTEFTSPTTDEWQAAVIASLGGKSFDTLVTTAYEGFDILPMYRREDIDSIAHVKSFPGEAPFVRATHAAGYLRRPWLIAQESESGSPNAFNRVLQFDLEHGQTAVNLLLDRPTRTGKDPDQGKPGEVGFGGVSLATIEDMGQALKGVDLATIPVFIRTGTVALPLLAILVAYLRRQGQQTNALQGCLENDPLGVLAHEGTLPLSLERAYDEMAQLTVWATRHASGLGTIAIHSYPYHNAGADAVQELGCALATGVSYLRAMVERGIDIDTVGPLMRFDLAISSNFFVEIAKLRAARMLWSQAIAAFGGDGTAQKLRLHGRTARRNKAAIDPYINMLRVTTEALAAAIGGVDSLHVAPFDEPIRPANDFSRRIARNVQIILQEEAHLTQVIDPAGGSYAVEALTEELARGGWMLFQDIERQGGMAAALQNGFVQTKIDGVATKRKTNLVRRRDVMVGVNQFANPAETFPPGDTADFKAMFRERAIQMERYRTHDDDPAAHLAALDQLAKLLTAPPEEMVEAAIEAAAAGATLNEITRVLRLGDQDRPTIVPVVIDRASEPFERLRQQADAYTKTHGIPPHIFLANIGPTRQHKARAEFAQSFFEVGGFQVLNNIGFPTTEAAVEAAVESRAPAVVICSTDETYPAIVPPIVQSIKVKSPDTVIILAGRPGEQVDVLRSAGVNEFIYSGADCLALNRWLLDSISSTTSS